MYPLRIVDTEGRPMKIINIQGGFRDYKKLRPGTMYHYDQLHPELLQNPSWWDKWFYVADAFVFFKKDGKKKIALVRERENLVLQQLDWFLDRYGDEEVYPLTESQLNRVLSSRDTLVLDLEALNPSYDNGWIVLNFPIYGEFNATPQQDLFLKRRVGQDWRKIHLPAELSKIKDVETVFLDTYDLPGGAYIGIRRMASIYRNEDNKDGYPGVGYLRGCLN